MVGESSLLMVQVLSQKLRVSTDRYGLGGRLSYPGRGLHLQGAEDMGGLPRASKSPQLIKEWSFNPTGVPAMV